MSYLQQMMKTILTKSNVGRTLVGIILCVTILVLATVMYWRSYSEQPALNSGNLRNVAPNKREENIAVPVRSQVPPLSDERTYSVEVQSLIVAAAKSQSTGEDLEGVIKRLSSFGDSVVPELAVVLKSSENTLVKEATAKTLAEIGTSMATSVLLDAMIDERDSNSRRVLASTLHILSNRESVVPLTKALMRTEDSIVSATVRDTLARLADDQTVAFISQAYHQTATEGWQQSNLLGVLGRVRSPEAVPGLRSLLADDSDWSVRVQAAISLGDIGDKASVESLVAVLLKQGVSDSITSVVVGSLGSVRNKDSLDEISGLLENSTNEMVRTGAAMSLRNFSSEQVSATLSHALQKETSQLVRQKIAESLRIIGGSEQTRN